MSLHPHKNNRLNVPLMAINCRVPQSGFKHQAQQNRFPLCRLIASYVQVERDI